MHHKKIRMKMIRKEGSCVSSPSSLLSDVMPRPLGRDYRTPPHGCVIYKLCLTIRLRLSGVIYMSRPPGRYPSGRHLPGVPV